MNKLPSKKNFSIKEAALGKAQLQGTIQAAKKKPYLTMVIVAAIPLVLLLAFTFKSGFVPSTSPSKKLDQIVVVKTPTEVADEATLALQKNDTDLFLDIIDKYAKKDVNIVNSKGDPLLVVAATIGNYSAVEELLSAGADVNKTNAFTKDTALLRSIYYDFPEITQRLIYSGANLNAKNNYNHSPLFLALEKKNGKLIDLFLASGVKEGLNSDYLFRAASQKNQVGVLAMLKGGIDPNIANEKGNTPLIISASLGDIPSVRHLLAYRADINAANKDGNTALIYAARYNHPDVIRELLRPQTLQAPLDVNMQNKNGETALYWGAAKGYTDVVKRLLAAGADPTLAAKDGFIPYRIAQKNGRGQVLEWFDKPIIEVKNSVIAADNAAILAKAKAEGREAEIEGLESSEKIEPLKEDDIFDAVAQNDVDKINNLLDEFGNVIFTRINKQGMNAFLVAVKNEHPDLLSYLAENGSRVFATSTFGNAFHIAVQTGNIDMVKELISLTRQTGNFVMMLEYRTPLNRFDGTKITQRSTVQTDASGKQAIMEMDMPLTPIGLAAYLCNEEMYKFLAENGAKIGSGAGSAADMMAQCKAKPAQAKNLKAKQADAGKAQVQKTGKQKNTRKK